MKRPHTLESGYVAFITVLIVGAAALAIGITLLSIGADSQRAGLIEQNSKIARAEAAACAEEALQVVHDNIAFSGTNSLTFATGGCNYTVVITTGTTRTITTSATVGNVVRKVQVNVTIGTSSISVTSWNEVS